MITWRTGIVRGIRLQEEDLQELEVEVEGETARAYNYTGLTGNAAIGDRVYLNTTAVELGLGSGGYHFVIANLERVPAPAAGPGHIMKLRYTPYQVKVLSSEEEAGPFREEVENFTSLQGTPVIVGTLHSQLAPAVAGCHLAAGRRIRVVYLMTDGAALPIALSRVVKQLKRQGLLAGTVTAGHAFGGDLEAVNIYSGLAVAFAALKADVIIVAMGPGIVGTGTRWGTTALEQGEILNAVQVLGGRGIALPRISFADPRPRHRGLSHHTATALGRVALVPALVALPRLPEAEGQLVEQQLVESAISLRHQVVVRDGAPALDYLREAGYKLSSMGRTSDDDPYFFEAAGAAGVLAGEIWRENQEEMTCLKEHRVGDKLVEVEQTAAAVADQETDARLREETIESRRVFDGKVIRVRVDTVRLPDGGLAKREVAEHPGAVVVVPVTSDNRVIMVRQYRHATGEILLELPAGKLNPSEEPLVCAQRELEEETGYTASSWETKFSFYTSPGFCDELLYLMVARGLTRGEAHPDAEEFLDVVSIPLDEALNMAYRGEIRDGKTLLGIMTLKMQEGCRGSD